MAQNNRTYRNVIKLCNDFIKGKVIQSCYMNISVKPIAFNGCSNFLGKVVPIFRCLRDKRFRKKHLHGMK